MEKTQIEEESEYLTPLLKDRTVSKNQKKIQSEKVDLNEEELEEFPETKGLMKYLIPLRMLFIWLFPLLFKGLRRYLKMSDLPKLSKELKCNTYESKHTTLWSFYEKFKKVQLILTIYTIFGLEFMFAGTLRLLSVILVVIAPIFLGKFLENLKPLVDDSDLQRFKILREILPESLSPPLSILDLGFRVNDYEIWLWLFALIGMQTISYIFQCYSFFMSMKVGNKIRTHLTNIIYKKIFRTQFNDKGRIMNLLATDVHLIDSFHGNFHESWTAVVLVGISTYFLFRIIGICSLYSLVVFICSVVLGIILLVIMYFVRFKYHAIIDRKVAIMKEYFKSILFVKMFQLEDICEKKLKRIRKIELKWVRVLFFIIALLKVLSYGVPQTMTFVGFISYYYTYGNVNIIIFLTSLTYFNLFRSALLSILGTLQTPVMALAAFKRVQDFLQTKDHLNLVSETKKVDFKINEKFAIVVRNGSFFWKQSKGVGLREFELKDINVEIVKGELIMITGKTKTGKSTFIKSLLGETMKELECDVGICGSLSYVSQEPFVFNDTISSNICFGSQMNVEKMERVVTCSGLSQDLRKMIGGIYQQVGEEGSTISGGQAARIALARAMYSESDIVLLDNPLGALDSFNTDYIFHHGILSEMKDRTRVMVTNKSKLLPFADRIFQFKKGGVFVIHTSYKQYCQENKIDEDEIYDTVLVKHPLDKYECNLDPESNTEKVIVTSDEERAIGTIQLTTLLSFISRSKFCCRNIDRNKNNTCGVLLGTLSIIIVTLIYGVGILVYFLAEFHVSEFASLDLYHQRYGNCFNTTYYQNHSIINGSIVYSQPEYYNISEIDYCNIHQFDANCTWQVVPITWNSNYQNSTIVQNGITPNISIMIYGILCLLILVLAFQSAAVCYFTFVQTSEQFFELAIGNLIRAPMNYFYQNFVGRLISRLTYDVSRSDMDVVANIEFLATTAFVVLCSIVLVLIATNGIFTPIIIVLFVINFVVYLFFRKNGIELKRLESVSRSNVFHSYSQTLNGLATIKAMKMDEHFIKLNQHWVNFNNRSYFLLETLKRTVELYSTLAGSFSNFLLFSFGVVFSYYIPWNNPIYNLLGLGLTNILLVIELLGVSTSSLIGLEITLNSTERLDYYARILKQENMEGITSSSSSSFGEQSNSVIEYRNFSTKYREDMPVVLKTINLEISRGEKVVIIGKSGSGKSSIFLSLMKILVASRGVLFIDGIDIKKINTKFLRGNISIVPQQPILFSGSILHNLDLKKEHTEERIWEVIRKCNFQDVVKRERGLEGKTNNLSLGEKRILSLCRSLLRDFKILLVDENTSIDEKLNRRIQRIITSIEQTVLTITHNVRNIVFYDKVVFVENGGILCDTPKNLCIKRECNLLSDSDRKHILEYIESNTIE